MQEEEPTAHIAGDQEDPEASGDQGHPRGPDDISEIVDMHGIPEQPLVIDPPLVVGEGHLATMELVPRPYQTVFYSLSVIITINTGLRNCFTIDNEVG